MEAAFDKSALSLREFLSFLFALPSLREGQDFFEGESSSLICLEALLNQQVGVERASAAALAVHYHFARPVAGLDRVLSEATAWPSPLKVGVVVPILWG